MLYLTEPAECGGASTNILPIYMLDNHYILHNLHNYTKPTQNIIAITTYTDQTEIEIPLLGLDTSIQISFLNTTYQHNETLYTSLNSFQTLYLEVNGDVTGLQIKSYNYVSVFLREQSNFVYMYKAGRSKGSDNDRSCTVVATYQILPVTKWGRHFLTFPYSETQDTIHITGKYLHICENMLTLHKVTM